MAKVDNKISVFTVTLLLGIFLQLIFVWAGNKDNPSRAAVEFTKAYFSLDPSMADRLCSEITKAENVDLVDNYLHKIHTKADARGFDRSFLRKSFDHIHTESITKNDTAVVHLTGTTRTCINPIFTWVARLFHLGKTSSVNEEIHLVLEDGQWKVCGAPFSLLADV